MPGPRGGAPTQHRSAIAPATTLLHDRMMTTPIRYAALLLGLLHAFAVPGVCAQDLPPQASEIRALLRAQKLDDAVTRGEAWTKASPKDAAAWHWLGRAYSQQALKASLFSKPAWASKLQDAFERAV